MSERRSTYLGVTVIAVILLFSAILYYKAMFPYGRSHCCIRGMSGALEQFAEENGGRYPAGEASPEASLSLLYKSNYIDAYTIRGMTVPERTVRAILEGGGLLGPDSCGWNYVPGLTRADNPELALLWCKIALGHDGQRTKDGGREVVVVGGGPKWVSGDEWPSFLAKQQELMKHRSPQALESKALVTGTIELPDGRRIDQVDAFCTMRTKSKGPDSSGSGSSSGTGLSRSELVWYRAPCQDGCITRTLSFSNLVSDPVTVTFTGGVPDVTDVVFKMRSTK